MTDSHGATPRVAIRLGTERAFATVGRIAASSSQKVNVVNRESVLSNSQARFTAHNAGLACCENNRTITRFASKRDILRRLGVEPSKSISAHMVRRWRAAENAG